ncbi:MAG: protein kinase family protein [Coxiellaceae bacterium]|nr:protein kinase family protein [Coxiellaceae bacterium]
MRHKLQSSDRTEWLGQQNFGGALRGFQSQFPAIFSDEKNGYVILKLGSLDTPEYYLIDKTIINTTNNPASYIAYPINTNTGQIDQDNIFTVQRYPTADAVQQLEAKLQKAVNDIRKEGVAHLATVDEYHYVLEEFELGKLRKAELKNFNLIAQLEQQKRYPGKQITVVEAQGIELVKLLDQQQRARFFVVDRQAYVGDGGFGTVLMAYPVADDGSITVEDPYVVKCMKTWQGAKDCKPYFERELLATKKMHNAYLVEFDDYKLDGESAPHHLFFTEFFSGKTVPLAADNERFLPFRRLSLADRLQGIVAFLNELQRIHEGGYAIETAYTHNDLNPKNILVDICQGISGLNVDVKIIDHGAALLVLDQTNQDSKFDATDMSVQHEGVKSVEWLDKQVGKKADVYAAVLTILLMLGVHDPYAEKSLYFGPYNQMRKTRERQGIEKPSRKESALLRALYSAPYAKPGLSSSFKLPVMIGYLLDKFIDRMQHIEYDKRPNTQECLQFFELLHRFVLYNERDEFNYKDIVAKMILIFCDKSNEIDRDLSKEKVDKTIQDFAKNRGLPQEGLFDRLGRALVDIFSANKEKARPKPAPKKESSITNDFEGAKFNNFF